MPLILLSFTPFVGFTLLSHLASVELGVWAAAILAIGLILSDWLRPGGSIKMLEAALAALFCLLAVYMLTAKAPQSVMLVRMVANGGLLAIALISLAIGKPFSLQYARETASPASLRSPVFLKENYRMTAVWTGVFAALFAASALAFYQPTTPVWVERSVVYGALIAGCVFTFWYVDRLRGRHRSQV